MKFQEETLDALEDSPKFSAIEPLNQWQNNVAPGSGSVLSYKTERNGIFGIRINFGGS